MLHRRDALEGTIRKGIERTCRYMDRCGAPVGHLVIFDPDPDKSWEDRIFRREESRAEREITVWGM